MAPILVVKETPRIAVIKEERRFAIIASPGPQGPRGVAGSSSSVVHNQTNASDTWTIPHGLGYVPNWFVRESTGDELEPNRTDPSVNVTIFDFDGAAVSGTAYGS